jgi:transporter family protein
MESSTPWVVWALLSAVFAALTAVFAKIGIQGLDSDFATFIRTAIVLLVLIAFLSYTQKWQDPTGLTGRNWLFLVLSALATGASWVCYFRALQAGPAASVAPIDKLSVVLVAVFAVLFLGERPAPREWLGLAMVAGGVVLIAFKC